MLNRVSKIMKSDLFIVNNILFIHTPERSLLINSYTVNAYPFRLFYFQFSQCIAKFLKVLNKVSVTITPISPYNRFS
jgi:hypothetical protein